MPDKKTIKILEEMLKKYQDTLTAEEAAALREAIGILAWSSLIEGRVKSIKKRRDERFQDE